MCKCTLTCYILIFLQEVRWLSGSHEVTSHCLFWLWYIWLWTGWTFSFCYISLNHTAMQQVRLYVSVLAYCVAVLGCVCVCVSGRGIILNFSPMYSSEVNKPDPIKAKHIMQQHQKKVISQEPEVYQWINIQRSKLFADALRAFSRHTFDVSKILRVDLLLSHQ